MQWRAMMELAPGTHQLSVSALHPSGLFTAWTTNSFTNNLAYQTTVDTFDGAGNITQRVWKNPNGTTSRTQTLSWDARGRLHQVSERDSGNSGYDWTASYDGLNRRLQTTTISISNGVAYNGSPQTINSYFDPEVEFLELGVSYGTRTAWKLYGPDVNGRYGGLNGVGGYEADTPELNLFNPTISDFRGNILAYYDSAKSSLVWNAARPTGFGAVPGYRPAAMGNGANLTQSSAWRGRWTDITGYLNLGLRPYDPISGRWLSGDSAPNGRDPNNYSFAGGDPVNYFDHDGRMSWRDYQNPFSADLKGVTWTWQLASGDSLAWEPVLLNGQYSFEGNNSVGNGSIVRTIGNSVMNTEARDFATDEWNGADWHSGWGITMKIASGVSYGANTIDAGANAIPLVGTGKAFVESAVKVAIKEIVNLGTKTAEKTGEDAFAFYLKKAQNLDVATAKNEAVFYSGKGNDVLAKQFAESNEKKTIEMTPGGKWLDDKKLFDPNTSPLTRPQAAQVWDVLSGRFANGASGTAVGFVEGASARGTFNRIESPALFNNPNILNIITGGY